MWILGACVVGHAQESPAPDLVALPLDAMAPLWPPYLEQLESTKATTGWYQHPSDTSTALGFSDALDHLVVLTEPLQPTKQPQHATETAEGFHAPNIAHSAFTLTTQTSSLKQARRADNTLQVFVQLDQEEVNGIQTETLSAEHLLVYGSDRRLVSIFSRERAEVDHDPGTLTLTLETLAWSPGGALEGSTRLQLFCRDPSQPGTCEATRQHTLVPGDER